MPYRDENYDLTVHFETRHYGLSAAEREKMVEDLHTLRNLVKTFPVADLHVEIEHHARHHEFHIKTSLRLPKRTLFTGDRDALPHPAYERCIRKLVHKVRAYKEKLGGKPDYTKHADGSPRQVVAETEPDLAAVDAAAQEQDFVAFRRALAVYDDTMGGRVGRWIQRYPEAESMLGRDILLSEVVEEVYLQAFEKYRQRPAGRLGGWLEGLIDHSIRILIHRGEAEIEELRAAQEPRSPPPEA